MSLAKIFRAKLSCVGVELSNIFIHNYNDTYNLMTSHHFGERFFITCLHQMPSNCIYNFMMTFHGQCQQSDFGQQRLLEGRPSLSLSLSLSLFVRFCCCDVSIPLDLVASARQPQGLCNCNICHDSVTR
jgi:hypothetical protein